MDRNLGATDTKGQESYGLLYQWGRKDPFIGGKANETVAFENSSELTVCNPTYSQAKWVAAECTTEIGSVKHAICQPMLFIYGDQVNSQANWLDPANTEEDWKYVTESHYGVLSRKAITIPVLPATRLLAGCVQQGSESCGSIPQ